MGLAFRSFVAFAGVIFSLSTPLMADVCPSNVRSYLTRNGRIDLLSQCYICGFNGGFTHINAGKGYKKLAVIVSQGDMARSLGSIAAADGTTYFDSSSVPEDFVVRKILSENNWEILHFQSGSDFEALYNQRLIQFLQNGSCREQILFIFLDSRTVYQRDPQVPSPFPQEILYTSGYQVLGNPDNMTTLLSILQNIFNYKQTSCSTGSTKTKFAFIDLSSGNEVSRIIRKSFSSTPSCQIANAVRVDDDYTGLATPSFSNDSATQSVYQWLWQRGWTIKVAYSRLSDMFRILVGMGSGKPLSISPGEAGQKLSPSFAGQAPGLDLGVLLHAMIQRKADGFHEINGVLTDVSSFISENPLTGSTNHFKISEQTLTSRAALLSVGGTEYHFPYASVDSLNVLWSFYKDTNFKQRWNQLVSNSSRFQEIKGLIEKLEDLVKNTVSRKRVAFLGSWLTVASDEAGNERNPTKDLSLVLNHLENLDTEIEAINWNDPKYGKQLTSRRRFIRFTYDLPTHPKMKALMYAFFGRFLFARRSTNLMTYGRVFDTNFSSLPPGQNMTPIENLKLTSFLNQPNQTFDFYLKRSDLVSADDILDPFHRFLNQKKFVSGQGAQRKIYRSCGYLLNMLSGWVYQYYPASLGGFTKDQLREYLQSLEGYDFCEWMDEQGRKSIARIFELASDGTHRLKDNVIAMNEVWDADGNNGQLVQVAWTPGNSTEFPEGFDKSRNTMPEQATQEMDVLVQKISMARMFLFADSIMKARSGSDANARACADFSIK